MAKAQDIDVELIEINVNGETYLTGKRTPNGIPLLQGKWEDVWPEGLLTKTQLNNAGYQTGKALPQPVVALVWSSRAGKRHGGYLYLYDPAQATPKRQMSDAQRAALEKAQAASDAQWYCVRCGERLERRGAKHCDQCDTIVWAQAVLQDGTALILDTETTGLYAGDGDEIIELAVINMTGDVLYNKRIQPRDPDRVHVTGDDDRCTYDIHGISADDLRSTQTFPELYKEIAAVLTGHKVLIYNSDFDSGMLAGMCRRYDLPVIE